MKIIFVNANNKSVEFGNSKPYVLISVDKTDIPEMDIFTQKAPFQDGVALLGYSLKSRDVVIEAVIIGDDENEVSFYRRELITLLNPKLGLGTLIYDDGIHQYKIKAIVDGAPIVSGSDRTKTYQRVLINLLCPEPYWSALHEMLEELALWRGALEFPLEIPAEGIEFGYRESTQVVTIDNQGDVPCALRVEFTALGTVKNPSLINVYTREFITINKVMQAGEKITITTDFANKRVVSEYEGIKQSALQYLDPNSTFLQLAVGENVLRYDAEENIDNLQVLLYYTPKYLGV
ncbi:MAG TPA: phage tail family protein [Fervidobacterium sp.]|nr:phage tail family protein [Fervidobacterium sp.]HUM44128.1 phage tail family protein [Fervidobacterium sp.]